jgi:hypothetical protein
VLTIKHGIVLDAVEMCKWGFAQTTALIEVIMDGTIKEGDIIYFEDFWHPGMEMIPYALSLKGLMGKVKLCAFCHAQSVDPNDFTAKLMMPWIRRFESAWSACFDKVFVASKDLAQALIAMGVCTSAQVDTIGTIFNSVHLLKMVLLDGRHYYVSDTMLRAPLVIYSSRLDHEKDPDFFVALARECIKQDKKIGFAICSGSNNQILPDNIKQLLSDHPQAIRYYGGLQKVAYFYDLATSAVQLNTAKQDFVSYTLLEATTFGCAPFYPRENASFGPALGFSEELTYSKSDPIEVTAKKLIALVHHQTKKKVFSPTEAVAGDEEFAFVYGKYNRSLYRMLCKLGLLSQIEGTMEQEYMYTAERAKVWDENYRKEVANG